MRRHDGVMNLTVSRRNDLRTAIVTPEVDLVTIVCRRIVARSDHDSCVNTQVSDGEGQDGGWGVLVEKKRPNPRGLHDFRGVTSKLPRLVSSVITHDH